MTECRRLDHFTNALAFFHDLLRVFGRNVHNKFITAIPCEHIDVRQDSAAAHDLTGGCKNVRAHQMIRCIVDRFKMVQVKHHDSKAILSVAAPANGCHKALIETAHVGQACQVVGHA